MEMIEFEKMENHDFDILKKLIENHYSNTNSKVAEDIIKDWSKTKNMFVKIMPTEFKAALEKLAKEKITQLIN
jgi:glutamate synthase (ferredoxin)